MDEAWCPVCDRLIPPNKLQVFPDDPCNKSSSSAKDAADLDDLATTANTTTNAPTRQPHQQQQQPPQRQPAPPKRAKSKSTQLKRTTSGKKLPAAKLGNLATIINANTTNNNPNGTSAGAAQPPDVVHPDLVVAPPAQGPPARPASTHANNSDNPKFASAASAPTSSTSAGKTNNTRNNKPGKPRTILTQPASLYCSERCRLADQRNYASGSVAGVIYSPSSSYTSSSFVAPAAGVLSSSYPVTHAAATTAGPAPAASRNSSQSRSRTRGGLSRHGSATIINTALANATATSSANPYYLASPLLSPIPSQGPRRPSSYSQNASDDEDGVPPSPVTYAYNPDRANSDYFRSLIRGGKQGYFTTRATVVSQTTPKDGETSSEGSGAPAWDYVAGGANAAGLSTSAGVAGRHTTFGVQSMTNIHNNDLSSSSASLLQLHGATPASASAATRPSSSRPRLPKGGNGTSAPAYIPTNGYLTHFSSLSLNNPAAGSNGHGHGYGYPYPYPDRPPYNAGHGYGHGYGYGWGRESASSSSSRRRRRSRQRHGVKNKDGQVPSKEHEDSASTSTKKPSLRTNAEERLPLFALEPAYPGPLSSTSDSEESDGDGGGGFVMGGARSHRRRRSSDENNSKVGARAESMTTAPSTESVQALLSAEAVFGSFPRNTTTEKELARVASAGATPLRPIPSRRRTITLEAHSKSSASLSMTVKNDKDVSSSRKMRHQRNVSKMGASSTAPAMPGGGPLSSSPFSSTNMTQISPPSRRHANSSTSTKARPEHQHGLLVHVALPRNSTASHSRSSSLGSTSTALGCLGAAKLAPSVSNIDASGTLVAQAAPSASGVLPPTIDDLLNSVPVHDVLPPRNDSSSRLRSQSHYQVGVAPGDEVKDPIARHTRSVSHTPAESFRSRVRLGSLYEHEDGDASSIVGGAATTKPTLSRNGSVNHLRLVQDDGFALDLETYIPTYPMEFLPGQLGEKRKKLFYFGGY